MTRELDQPENSIDAAITAMVDLDRRFGALAGHSLSWHGECFGRVSDP